MTSAKARVARLLLAGGLLCGGHAPAFGDGRAPNEVQVKKEVTKAARDFLEAVRKRDVKAILAMVSERGFYCVDDYTPKSELAVALRKPGTFYHALLFDTARLREYVDAEPPVVSLLESLESGGELTLDVLFLEVLGEQPWALPCVYVKAARIQEAQRLCFKKEKGRWRLWKSPDPSCD